MTGRVLQFDPVAHKVADVLLPWFVNETLEGDELAFVEQHVAACPRCQREVEWLREFHAACVAGESMPETARAFRKLRQQLDTRSQRGSTPARPDDRGAGLRPWSRWVIAAQLVIILGLGGLLFVGEQNSAAYRTLGARSASSPVTGALVVVFDAGTTEADLRRILRGAGARVVDGPTQSNAYVLDVPAEARDRAVQALRSERAVVMVEPLGPGATR